jgi:putative SOS response-associated peptidase YedK
MCNRYYIEVEDREDDVEELRRLMQELQRKSPERAAAVKTKEVSPTDLALVIANNRRLVPAPLAMNWGYTLPGGGKPVTNARSETAAEKPMFRDGMLNRRCLVPASNYFEWEKRGKDRIKYAIRPAGRPVFYMAGVYRIEGNKPVFAILTREPAEPIAFIHDRMPVILPAEAHAEWLDIRSDGRDALRSALTDMSYGLVTA